MQLLWYHCSIFMSERREAHKPWTVKPDPYLDPCVSSLPRFALIFVRLPNEMERTKPLAECLAYGIHSASRPVQLCFLCGSIHSRPLDLCYANTITVNSELASPSNSSSLSLFPTKFFGSNYHCCWLRDCRVVLVNTLHEVSLYKLEHKVTRMYSMAVHPHTVLLSVSVSLYSRGNIL